MRKIVWLEDRT